ncbi:integral membrane protein MviN [Sphaerochaeta pleomorpha str. Grapes]|uniref:Integral membrane protein MviN n=1 Tax=Sphaerochaeta pleomorpha (strain ATCC BAA-1885 / DSM 22778 / Grapes) TaxID=158190 RepID=G8QW34_SPHPG|nr:murein biosynthesis integral membrane protein MurJ [Sphaerochaeta pleomorpha]AEV28277.1 integral membrane protein MviN [Sphaerochaeta pleomorpha str. Grapes]
MHDSTNDKSSEKSSITVMVCTLASRLLGILKARIIGSIFGASGIADVINFTFNIPNNFRKIFAEGALNGALIPYFTTLIESGEKKKANRLMALLCTYQLLFFVPLCILSYFLGEPLIAFFSDFTADKVALGAKLLPFFMVFLATISIGTTFNGLLFCHKSFFHASFAPLLFSLSVIFGVQFFHESLGAMSMAYATVIGGGLQGLYSYFAVRRFGYRLQVAVKPLGTPFKPLMIAWLHVMLGSSFLVVGQLIAYWFASGLSVGSVTAFSNSMIFWQTPYGIFFNAIVMVSFPLMSRSWALGSIDDLQKQAGTALQYLATFLFPSFILLYFLSNECVSAVLQTGNYSLTDSLLTANVLRYYLWGMVIIAWYGLLQRLGYSVNRHRQMTIVSIIQTALDILCMWVLLHYGLGIIALPIANAISFFIGLVILIVILKDVYPITRDRRLAKGLLRLVIANLPLLGLCVLYSSWKLTWYQSGSNLKTFFFVCLLGLTGVGVTVLSYSIFRIPFLQILFARKQRKENTQE